MRACARARVRVCVCVYIYICILPINRKTNINYNYPPTMGEFKNACHKHKKSCVCTKHNACYEHTVKWLVNQQRIFHNSNMLWKDRVKRNLTHNLSIERFFLSKSKSKTLYNTQPQTFNF